VITHAHIDHIGGAQKLKQATGAPVYMNPDDEELQEMNGRAGGLAGDASAGAGRNRRASQGRRQAGSGGHRVSRAPHARPHAGQHQPVDSSERKLVAGDTLFRDSIGRTDLPGGDGRQIIRSIRDKLMPLPDDTEVIPGHGDNTTIGHEKQFNYFLQGDAGQAKAFFTFGPHWWGML